MVSFVEVLTENKTVLGCVKFIYFGFIFIFHVFLNIYATCIASFIARKLNEYDMQIIYLLVVLQQSVCEAWGKRGGFDEKLHREGKGGGLNKDVWLSLRDQTLPYFSR